LIDDCVFCNIAVGRIPAEVVRKSPSVIAFRDINPAAPTHVLLIPKEHVADSAAGITAQHGGMLGELFELAAEIAGTEGLGAGWRLVSNVGPAAGQTIDHLHFHLLGGWPTDHSAPQLEEEHGG
jgi:histidine triad (HIT) family protein